MGKSGRGLDGQIASQTIDYRINLGKLWETVRDREPCCAAVHRVTKSQTEQQQMGKIKIERGGKYMYDYVWFSW